MPKFNVSSCTVQKLDGEDLIVDVKNFRKGQDLLDEVCKVIGVEDQVYFGLRYTHPRDEKTSWFDTNKPLKKQLRKASNRFRFGVQFYPVNHHEIKHDFTRYQFVLQAREHFLTAQWTCSIPTQALLGSYVTQAEFGNYDANVHQEGYLNDLFFMPNQAEGFLSKVKNFHQRHTDLSPSEVDFLYLENAQKTGLYGMDLHDVWDKDKNMMKFGITSNGIHILHMNTILHTFLWPAVERCVYKKKEVLIRLKIGEKTVPVMFSTSSRTEAKRVVENCVLVKYFSLNGKRKIIRRKKPLPSEDCGHSVTDDEVDDKQFSRVDSKRFSKRFVARKDSLTLDLGSDHSSPVSDKKDFQSPVMDNGDVYLGYPNEMTVPTITQTAPSEQSFSSNSEQDKMSPRKENPTENPPSQEVSPEHKPNSVSNSSEIDGHKKNKEEHVEVIEVVEIEYVTERSGSGVASKETDEGSTNTEEREEVTSKVVEIEIITTEFDSESEKEITTKKSEEIDHNGEVHEDPVDVDATKSEADQEIVVIYGNETIESIDESGQTKQVDSEPTLLESIEKELNDDSYEIVNEEVENGGVEGEMKTEEGVVDS